LLQNLGFQDNDNKLRTSMSILNGESVKGTPEWAERIRQIFRDAGNNVPPSNEVARVDLNTVDQNLSGSVPVDIHGAVYRGEITKIPDQFRSSASKPAVVIGIDLPPKAEVAAMNGWTGMPMPRSA
jgi:hypothetical protein